MVKKIIIEKLFAYLEAYLQEHADELIDKGAAYVLQLVAIIKGKILPEQEVFSSDDPVLCGFASRCDEIVASVSNDEV